LKGTLVAFDHDPNTILFPDPDNTQIKMPWPELDHSEYPARCVSKQGNLLVVWHDHKVSEYQFKNRKWKKTDLSFSQTPGKIIAISPDKTLLCCLKDHSFIDYDVPHAQVRYSIKKKTVEDTDYELQYTAFSYDNRYLLLMDSDLINLETKQVKKIEARRAYSFNPNKAELAWVSKYWDGKLEVYQCDTGKIRTIKVPHRSVAGSTVGWSPDGKYLVYAGCANRYTEETWYPDIRIIQADGKKSVTLSKWRLGYTICYFYWLPEK
jgi:WD40 repeat protein